MKVLSLNNILVGIGTDVAGEVVQVGLGVKNFKAGDKVVAMVNPLVSLCLHSCGFFIPMEMLGFSLSTSKKYAMC